MRMFSISGLTTSSSFDLVPEVFPFPFNDNAENFPKVAVDAYSPVVIGVELSPLLWIGVISPWFQILGMMPELRMMLKSLSIANWNLWSVYVGYHQPH
jgi:hypothetical protein